MPMIAQRKHGQKQRKERNIFMIKPGDSQTKKTMHELCKEFPNQSYRELEIYREKDRQEEAQRIFTQQENEELTESQQKQEELEPIQHGMSSDAQKNNEISALKDQIKKLKKEIKELKYADSGK